jgi:hypothetical protein
MSVPGRIPFGAFAASTLLPYSASGKAKVVPVSVTLTPTAGAKTVNLTALPDGNSIGSIASVYVDNSANGIPVALQFSDTSQNITVGAYTQGYFAVTSAVPIFVVTAPLIGVLGNPLTVDVQVCNFPLTPAVSSGLIPDANAGVSQSVGNAAGWNSYSGTVPGTAALYSALDVDSSAFGGTITISGTAIDGTAWTVQQQPLQNGEFVIPATAAGTPFTATATIPLGGTTPALIPIRWRIVPTGRKPSYNVPLYMPWTTQSWTSLPAGLTSVALFPALAGNGVYIDKISVTAAGWSAAFGVTIGDSGYPGGYNVFSATFPAGNVAYGNDIGYVSYARDAAVNIQVTNAAAATGGLVVSLRGSYVAASQSG